VSIAFLVAAHQLLSYLWYSPYLFAFDWIEASGFRLSRVPPSGTPAYYWPFVLSILNSIVLCYAMTWLYKRLAVTTALQGLGWALVLWFVFAFANMAVHHQFAQQAWALTLIDGGRDLLLFVLTGAVLGARLQRTLSHA
jgi:hypothetical protein